MMGDMAMPDPEPPDVGIAARDGASDAPSHVLRNPRLGEPLGAREVRVYTLDTGDRQQVRLVTRVLLALQLGGVSPERVSFTYGPKGKPFVRNDASLRFSVSHADDVSMIAVTRLANVGVDVEAVREVPRAAAIARRFFPPSQFEALLAGERGHEQFAREWTRAEATVKVRGASIWEAGTPDPSVTTRVLDAPPGYVATAAVAEAEWDLVQHTVDAATFQLAG
jgi:4'-phosphopantetheinyl transferase